MVLIISSGLKSTNRILQSAFPGLPSGIPEHLSYVENTSTMGLRPSTDGQVSK